MRISDWSSDVCSSDLTLLRLAVQAGARRLYCEPALFEQGEIAIVADRPTAALIEQSSLQRIEYGGMGLGRSAIMMPIIRLAGPLLVKSPATARYLPHVTALLWVAVALRSEEHTSELQSLIRISYAVFCLQK